MSRLAALVLGFVLSLVFIETLHHRSGRATTADRLDHDGGERSPVDSTAARDPEGARHDGSNGRSDHRSDHPNGRGAAPGTAPGGRSVAEWVTLGISLAIVLGLTGVVGYLALAGDDRPVSIQVEPRFDAVRYEGGHHYVPLRIQNRGDRTAEDVRLELTLATPQGRREPASLVIPFLAGGEIISATVAFRDDPRQNPLSVEVISYLEP